MHYEKRFPVDGEEIGVREGVRAFFVGEGYDGEAEAGDEQRFVKRSTFWKSFSSRVEDLPATVYVRTFSTSDADGTRTGIQIEYDVRPGLRLLTRIDQLFFALESDGLREYLASGVRRDAAGRLAPVRGPVRIALAMNFLISSLLVATLGVVAGFHIWVTVGVAAVVAFLNFVSILGFAEILVEGMERIRPRAG